MNERRVDPNEDIETPSGPDAARNPTGTEDAENPTGGDKTTEDQLVADNPAEEETLKALDPDAPSS